MSFLDAVDDGFNDLPKPKPGRHQLTPEERARGHKLTKADRIKGGRNVPRAKRAAAALKYPAHIERLVEMGAKYRLTSERARELAKLSAQVRREQRAQALVTLALDKPLGPGTFDDPLWDLPAKREMEPNSKPAFPPGTTIGYRVESEFPTPVELYPGHEEHDPDLMGPPPPDPFTLSALKRFLPGPRSPLSLTRSQRAHVDIMVAGGWLEVTGDSMLRLTAKGRAAVEGSEEP